ncbi:hypothetical protein K1719_015085 [Acacia pycnantha]|nr:hypothetical protein K1719_015085 [Acacia pycnantha]
MGEEGDREREALIEATKRFCGKGTSFALMEGSHSSPLYFLVYWAINAERHLVLVLCLLLFISIFGHCHGSRTNVFKVKPKPEHSGHFLGFLPRRLPVPYSSPSRKHNDIGLRSWRSP